MLGPGVPRIGAFFSPFQGFWQNCDPDDPELNEIIKSDKLKEEVDIAFDERMTPHVFAKNDHDLYFAQGYLTARFRLWQMEIQTLFASGRLSEVMGENLIKSDRFYRRIGMVTAAETSLNEMMEDSISKNILLAYTDGVNAYIDQLPKSKRPFEYKLLDYKPEKWTPLKTALLLKYMAWDLTGSNNDVEMTHILKEYGPKITQDLFPNFHPFTDPIIPTGTKWDFPLPKLPKIPTGPYQGQIDEPEMSSTNQPISKERINPKINLDNDNYHDINGSNNWALGGNKTSSGYPLLSNDPHLKLSLPSIWLEMQLISPNVNVYGVTLPGAPGVIIGYNDHISWGVTNSGADVFDWYKIKYQDEKKVHYRYGDRYRDIIRRIDTIKVRGKDDYPDTILSTHHGPIVYDKPNKLNKPEIPLDCAMRWAAHSPSNELKTFYLLNRAKTYTHYLQALSTYGCPAQNFAFADRNNIALRVNGYFPVRWVGQGKYILDGADPRNEWNGWIPRDNIPAVRNPSRGFVSSANQASADTSYPYYLDYNFEPFERGARINSVLDSMSNANVDSMIALQNDNYNLLARKVLPKMLRKTAKTGKNKFSDRAYLTMNTWNYQNDPAAIGASIFNLWWHYLEINIWEDNFPTNTMMYPSRARTAQLITMDTTRKWYDDITTTDKKETFTDLVNASFQMALDSLERKFPRFEHWTWANVKATHIPHMTRNKSLKSFGRWNLDIGGGVGIVNATSESHGPSWRMVVSMGPLVRGYGIYPGGQSGNPASEYYDNMVDKWVKGKLDELIFMRKYNSQARYVVGTLKMSKE